MEARDLWEESGGDPLRLAELLGTIEPAQMITVRLPRSIHAALKDEAHRERVSLNQLCVRRLADVTIQRAAIAIADEYLAAANRTSDTERAGGAGHP